MQENIFEPKFENYWRTIDKKIFFCFITLFFLGLFFSFSSTSSLAGERLNKDYYFFFFKTFNFYLFSFIYNVFFINFRNFILKETNSTTFYIFIYIFGSSSNNWSRSQRSKKVVRFLHFSITTNWITQTFFYPNHSTNFNFRKV